MSGRRKTDAYRLKEKRGQGYGSDYTPWLHPREVSSRGLSTRERGLITGRMHCFLSQIEWHYFIILDSARGITDIREQYPLLELEETIELATRLGIKHPQNPYTKQLSVMTTDFVITVQHGITETQFARAIKPASELKKARVLEKLEIERAYWAHRQINWAIVTERDIPINLVRNLQILRAHHTPPAIPAVIATTLQHELLSALEQQLVPIADIARHCDQTFQLPSGTTLALIYHLIEQRVVIVDLYVPLNPKRCLALKRSAP